MFPLMFPRTHLSRHKPGTRPLHRQPSPTATNRASVLYTGSPSPTATNRAPVPCTSIPLPPYAGHQSSAQAAPPLLPQTGRPSPCTSIPLPPQTGRPSPVQPLPCCHTPQRRCASLLTGSTPSSGCRAALTSAFSSHGLLFADFTIILTIIRYDNRQKLSCNPLRPI